MPTPMKEVPPLAAVMVVEEEQCSGASSLANASNNNEAWTCSCNMQWPSTQKRCGNTKCNKWKGGKRDGFIVHRPNVPSSIASAPTTITTKQRPQDPSTVTAVQQQANTIDCWTCDNCQNIVKANKVRCGKCHHWKGGKRTTVKKTTAKNDSDNDDNSGGSLLPSSSSSGAAVGNNGGGGTANNNKASYPFDITQDWTCNNCSITLPGRQTRCGKCHKWRGGKRQGGWTLKAKSTKGGQEEEDDGIDRTVDWTCCEAVLPARQTRCGKCHKWRGGKRVFAGNNGGNSKKSKKEGNKKAKVVPSGNGLKENGDQMKAPSVHQHHHHSLANDKADNNIVFEYPMPCAPAAAAPLYHPMPAISSTAGYLPLPSPITKAAAEVFMNSAEI